MAEPTVSNFSPGPAGEKLPITPHCSWGTPIDPETGDLHLYKLDTGEEVPGEVSTAEDSGLLWTKLTLAADALVKGQRYRAVASAVGQDGTKMRRPFEWGFVAEGPLPPPTAKFLGVDTDSQGKWRQRYGSLAYLLAKGPTSKPDWFSCIPSMATMKTWAEHSDDVRAPERPDSGDGLASCWYHASEWWHNLDIQNGLPYRVSLYLLDWERAGRSQTVEVRDGKSQAVLDTREVPHFAEGVYLLYEMSGPLKVYCRKKAGPDSVVSGVFLDPRS
jgi:hypothetical protein